MLLAWDRQKGEPAAHYAWFVRYDGLGPGERSLETVAADVGKSRRQVERVSSQWRWVQRAAAHDEYEAERWRAKNIAKQRVMCDRHAQMAVAMQNQVVRRLQGLRSEDLSPGDVARWVEISTRVERTALGLPETTTALTGADGGALQMTIANLDEEAKKAYFARLVAEANSRAGITRPGGSESEEEEAGG